MFDQIAYMTWKNPIFMLLFFGILWYLPGLIVRRRSEFLYLKRKEAARQDKLSKLYPKNLNEDEQ